MKSDMEALRNTEIFSEVPDQHLEQLALRTRHQHFEPQEVLFEHGDPGDAAFVIESGEVRLEVSSNTGRRVALATLLPGDTFGELALFDGVPRSATATAVEATTCIRLARQDFLEVVEAEPAAVRAILRSLARIVRRTNEQLIDSFLPYYVRVGRALRELAERHGRQVEDGIVIAREVSRDELATLAGVYPHEVDRALELLQYADTIRVVLGEITILDVRALSRPLA